MPLIFLVGFMGAGKTTFGKKLANKLKFPFIDIDELVIQHCGVSSIKELIETRGMDFFRQAESEVLKGLTLTGAVISTGGGTPCYFDNMKWMKSKGVVVFLKPDEGVIFSRLRATDLAERPLLRGLDDEGLKAFIRDTLAQRLPFYEQANITFDPVHEKISELLDKLSAH